MVRIQQGGKEASGFVVDPSGLVITNCRALVDAPASNVVFHDNSSASVEGYVGVDVARDIIVLKVKAAGPLASLSLRADPPKPRELVFAFGAIPRIRANALRGLVESVQTSQQCQVAYKETTGRFRRPADALWLRVTSAIFASNWGGPLVDEHGQVVGINSRTKMTGLNLSFAISSQDIAKLLSASAANEVQSLGDLPGTHPSRGSHTQPFGSGSMQGAPEYRYDGFPLVRLPSGSDLSYGAVRIPDDWPESHVSKEAGVRTINFPSGKPKSLHAFLNARLHGPSFLLHDDGSQRWAADYLEGERDGALRLWDTSSEMALFAEYVRNGKKGLVCVFQSGMPWLIQEWDKNQMTHEYLVRWNAGVPRLVDCDNLAGPAESQEVAAAHDRIAELEAVFLDEETEVKQDLAAWFRETNRQLKQQRAAAVSVRKRGQIIGAMNARDAQEQSNLGGMWRRAMTGR